NDSNGDRVLWDTNERGFCVKEDGNHFKDARVHPSVETERENELLQAELSKALKQKQKLQDQLNLSRKMVRGQNRSDNFSEIMIESCKEIINNFEKKKIKQDRHVDMDSSAVLVISDTHYGQLVQEVNNYFDLEVADDRLESIFNQFEKEIELRGIGDVNILLLGDLIHAQPVGSSKKTDMKASGIIPEVQSTIMCFKSLSANIDRLAERYNVSIGAVVGNESRFNSHINPSNLQSEARNNMDVVIFEMLKQRYRDLPNVSFLNNGDELESVVEINGKSILMTHGNNLGHQNLEKSVVGMRTRLEKVYGDIDFTVLGHIHSCLIGDTYLRNSSLVGSNGYSNSLGIIESTVSQNCMIINEDGIKAFSLKA
ncbi:MAG: hypothetical protein ACRCZ2_12890, partial [Fusobacteriaceae bacterium]